MKVLICLVIGIHNYILPEKTEHAKYSAKDLTIRHDNRLHGIIFRLKTDVVSFAIEGLDRRGIIDQSYNHIAIGRRLTPVSYTHLGEYLDIEIGNELSSEAAVKRLNGVMAEGVEVLSFRKIPEEKSANAMSLVAAADYEVRFRENSLPEGCVFGNCLLYTSRSSAAVILSCLP